MPAFTVTGPLPRLPRSVTWTDGELSGDEAAVATVQGVIAAAVPVSLPGLYYGPPGLEEHGAALVTVLAAFPESTVTAGDAPVWQPVPPGAIP